MVTKYNTYTCYTSWKLNVFLLIISNNSDYSYTYTESAGVCEFSDSSTDYNQYDYDFTEEDKDQCLQSCLQKSFPIDHAVGCSFENGLTDASKCAHRSSDPKSLAWARFPFLYT